MDNLLPAWMHDGGISKLLERLADPKARQRAIGDCLVDGERWRTGSGGMGWDEIMIATCSKPELAGIHVAELARRTGKEPAQAMMDLVMEERAGVSMVVFSQSEENVGTALSYAHNMVGSDSLSLHAGTGPHPGKPHPRSYGTFPRVLGVYCREKRLFSWETAVHKMTGMPATKLGLKDRGLVQGGRAADLTLFDPATVRDEATFPDPHRHPVGIPYVIVNGRVVVDGARYHAVPAGRVLASVPPPNRRGGRLRGPATVAQVLDRGQCGGRPVAGCGHELARRLGAHVARGEDARHAGAHAEVGHDLSARVERHEPAQDLGVWREPRVDEHAAGGHRVGLAGGQVLDLHPLDAVRALDRARARCSSGRRSCARRGSAPGGSRRRAGCRGGAAPSPRRRTG